MRSTTKARKEADNCTAHIYIRNLPATARSNLAQSHSRGFGPPESSVLPPYSPHPAHKCPGVRGNGPRSSKRDFPHGRGSPHWAPKSCVSRWGCYSFDAFPGEHARVPRRKGRPYLHFNHPAKLIRRNCVRQGAVSPQTAVLLIYISLSDLRWA